MAYFKLILPVLLIGFANVAHADDVVLLGGRYVGSTKQPNGFNNKDNPYAFTQGASTQDQMRKQFEDNKAAYRRGIKPSDNKVAKSKPLLGPSNVKEAEKKARCLTGNYDGC